ncbi:alpha/beta fold hydrolase [uncultured Winogradskyella sp.]|uniref:alpha/beta hydrolase n=1 Tax=uncultured Winogradskyella sp. TaxID=395353 RepID=UPI002609AB35|nr:alpha/beta fold hydrolase [uncultured Winogradskyella sp.]
MPRLISEIRNPVVSLIKRNRNVNHQIVSYNNPKLKQKDFFFSSFDNLKLSAQISYSSADSVKGTIILLHGIRSDKYQFKNAIQFLSENGYNSVGLDSRAHGKSEGDFCTFGVREKRDIKTLIDYLSEKENLHHFGIWGQSLGGAIGLQAMGYDKRIKFGIIESTFSDFKSIVNDYFDLHAGFSYYPFSNYLVNRTGEIAGFDPNDAKPIKYCKSITQPILLVHGNLDKRINIKYGRENFSVIPSKNKQFIEIDSANHANVWKVGGQKYFDNVLKFMYQQQNKNPSN